MNRNTHRIADHLYVCCCWRAALSEYLSLFLVAGLIVLLDQLSKYIIRSNLALGEIYRPDLWITQIARIVHWQNTGAAFGMFQSLGNVFMILSMVVSAAIIYYYPQVPRKTGWCVWQWGCCLEGRRAI